MRQEEEIKGIQIGKEVLNSLIYRRHVLIPKRSEKLHQKSRHHKQLL
jgi:hypothetical protein